MTSSEHYNQFDVSGGLSAPIENTYANTASALVDDDHFYHPFLGGLGSKSESGIAVNPNTALSHGPVWQAVNLLAGDLGQLPFRKMIKGDRNREKDRKHNVDWMMRAEPNGYQRPAVWKETMLSWALLWGNGISYVVRDDRGRPKELLPLLPDRTNYRVDNGEWTVYTTIGRENFFFQSWELFHIRGLSSNGFWGRSAVEVAKDVVGYGLGLRKHGNKTFQNGAVPRGVIEHPGKLSVESRGNLRNEWNKLHGGLDNTSRVAIMMEGAKFTQTTLSNVDSQWLEAVKLDREQVASLFNLPAHKLNALENSAVRSNVEEQNRSYMQTSLSRWLNRFREEAEAKLLSKRERVSGDHYFKWFVEAFLRGDTKVRFEAYSKAIASRWMNPNEVREMEDMNPYEGGDEFANPAVDTLKGKTREEGPGEDGGNEEAKEAAIGILKLQILALLNKEANDIARAYKAKDFPAWVESYYSGYGKSVEKHTHEIGNLMTLIGVSHNCREKLLSHGENSKVILLGGYDALSHSSALRIRTDELLGSILRKENYGSRNLD